MQVLQFGMVVLIIPSLSVKLRKNAAICITVLMPFKAGGKVSALLKSPLTTSTTSSTNTDAFATSRTKIRASYLFAKMRQANLLPTFPETSVTKI